MSLELRVDLDDDGPVRTGGVLSGRVRVRSSSGAEVRGVRLEVGWRTEGDGNRAAGVLHAEELLERPIHLGRDESRDLPFRLEVPPGPLSYQGNRLRIVNVLKATADVPWTRDPSAEKVYELRRADEQRTAFQGPLLDEAAMAPGPVRIRAHPRALHLVLAGLALVAGVGIGIGAVVVRSSPPLLAILLGISGPIVAAAVLLPFRTRIAERRLGQVDLVLDRVVAAPGETIRAALTFEPRSDIRIQRATASLRGREKVVRGAGQHQTVRRHKFTLAEARLVPDAPLAVGERVTMWAPLPLTPDCPCSFRARDNQLDFEVEVRIAIAGWPDWVAAHPVVVWPTTMAGEVHRQD
jgi:hypothetical protein